ncbi:hypothetical protein [Streptomyces sp. GbtcB7]|uniref:hypothetical protein n=1 Tax=Streptomyces sp. GbtcB7 TaxID=2824752 RepID=UPI001C2F40E9|nr:hypothetical protein [Streptomyces sp. GbtcB7]
MDLAVDGEEQLQVGAFVGRGVTGGEAGVGIAVGAAQVAAALQVAPQEAECLLAVVEGDLVGRAGDVAGLDQQGPEVLSGVALQ